LRTISTEVSDGVTQFESDPDRITLQPLYHAVRVNQFQLTATSAVRGPFGSSS
jgi:hypothetical protein